MDREPTHDYRWLSGKMSPPNLRLQLTPGASLAGAAEPQIRWADPELLWFRGL
jgi:hypothetical protein